MYDQPHVRREIAANAGSGRGWGRLRHGNPGGDLTKVVPCGAATRAGTACRQPAMQNGRCRLHGGKSTGPRTAAGLARSRAARLRHGARTAAMTALYRDVRQALAAMDACIARARADLGRRPPAKSPINPMSGEPDPAATPPPPAG